MATEPRYSYASSSPSIGVDPEGTDGIFGFNSVQEFWDTISYIPEATEEEAFDLRNQLQEYLVMNIGSLIGFCADEDAVAHRWLKTYGNIKSSLPQPMQAVMPPSTSLREVAKWMEAFATNYLIGFGSEALQTAQQMVLAAIPGYNAYQFLVGSFEQARQIVALVTEIVKDASFFHSLGVSFDVFLVRHIGGPLINALIAVMKTKAVPPEILGSLAGAVAFQVCLILLLELVSEGAATPFIAAEEGTEFASILSRLAQSTGRIGKVAQKTGKLVADYSDVIDLAKSLKNRADLTRKAMQWLGKLTADRRAVHNASSDINARHTHVGARIKALEDEEQLIFHKKVTWTSTGRYGTGKTYVVIQRDDIDWNRIRTKANRMRGKTNAEAAREGYAPELPDGASVRLTTNPPIVNMHHIEQNADGPLVEVHSDTHLARSTSNQMILHSQHGTNKGHPTNPVNQDLFRLDVVEYWMWREQHR